MTRNARLPISLLLATTALGTVRVAFAADEKAVCLAAFEDSQKLRAANNRTEALDRARVCARPVCPTVVQNMCQTWAKELAIPATSLGVEVRDDAGAVVHDARVTVDGKEMKDGASLALEAGEHRVRVERAGGAPVEQSVAVKTGETRTLTVVLTRPAAPAPAAPVAPPPPAEEPPTPGQRRGPLPYVLAGVGVVGLGSFAFFAASGKSQQHDLESSCAPTCASDKVSPVRTKYLIADLSLLVGLASLGAATWMFVSTPPPTTGSNGPSLRVGAAAVPGLATVSLGGAF